MKQRKWMAPNILSYKYSMLAAISSYTYESVLQMQAGPFLTLPPNNPN